MRPITEIIVHCTASPEGRSMTVKQIDDIHRNQNHWACIGYHKVIYLDGSIHDGRPIERMGAHCNEDGHNRYSIGVVYVGGCAKDGKTPKDTRTPEQKEALAKLLEELHRQFPMAKLYGHRELVCSLKKKDSSFPCSKFCLTLTACAAKRSATKAVSERETVSVTESRLSFYRTIDSLSRQFCLSADSISIIFCNASSPEFPTAFPSEIEGCAETPSPSQANKRMPQAGKRPSIASPLSQVPSSLLIPQSLKIYGLHLNENIEKKSVESADLKDSVNTFTQSEKIKSASKQSSKPSSAPYYIIFIFILMVIIYTVHRLRRFF